MAKISIVVPTYNERENLPALTARVHDSLSEYDYELIIVDDNSPDGTGLLAEELAQEKPTTIRVIHREGKLGLASAVIDGFEQAEGDILGVIDADLQHPPEQLPDLLQKIGGADIVIASRYIPGGGVEKWSLIREIVSRGAKLMPQFLFAKIRNVNDPLSGFFIFKRCIIEGIRLNPIGYKILLEILVKGRYHSVAEVPYVFRGRERGKSNLNSTEEINYLRHLYRLVKSEGESRRFIKYCLVGASGVFVNMGLLALLTEAIGLLYSFSAIIAIEASIINNFTWNELWTFRDRRTLNQGAFITRMAKFNLVSLLGMGINIGILHFFTEIGQIHYMISEIFGIIAATIFNFIFNKWWTWQ